MAATFGFVFIGATPASAATRYCSSDWVTSNNLSYFQNGTSAQQYGGNVKHCATTFKTDWLVNGYYNFNIVYGTGASGNSVAWFNSSNTGKRVFRINFRSKYGIIANSETTGLPDGLWVDPNEQITYHVANVGALDYALIDGTSYLMTTTKFSGPDGFASVCPAYYECETDMQYSGYPNGNTPYSYWITNKNYLNF